jgi:hypothetical protein
MCQEMDEAFKPLISSNLFRSKDNAAICALRDAILIVILSNWRGSQCPQCCQTISPMAISIAIFVPVAPMMRAGADTLSCLMPKG